MTHAYGVRLILGLSVGLACLGHAQGPARLMMRHDDWSTENGLPQNSVHQIIQSHDGFIWMSTEGGAVRYDGYSFKVLNHDTDPAFTTSDVTSVAEDRRGNLWFGTADGLVEYTNHRSRHFGQPEGLVIQAVLSVVATDDGSILVLGPDMLQRFDGSKFESIPIRDRAIESLQPQTDGSVLLLASGGALRYTHGNFSEFALQTIDQREHVLGTIVRPDGAVWTWTRSRLQVAAKGQTWSWQVGQDLPGARIQVVTLDYHRSAAWVGTNRGVVIIVPGQRPRLVGDLGTNSILSILQDREGNVWVGTDATGLHALRLRSFYAQPAVAGEEVSCVAEASDGAIWVGTRQDGLRRIRANDDVDRPVRTDALTSPVILSLAAGREGDMWVGTPDGLTHVTSRGSTVRYTSSGGLPDDMVRSLLTGRDGTLWVGTRHGLGELKAGRLLTVARPSNLTNDLIGPLFESTTGDLWVGTGSTLLRRHDGTFQEVEPQDGRRLNAVTSITEDTFGHLWISTQRNGLYLWDGNALTAREIPELPTELYVIMADPKGFLWIRGRRNIIRTPIQDLLGCVSPSHCRVSLSSIVSADGLPSEDFLYDSRPSIMRTSSGELWVATRKGIAVANLNTLTINEIPPPVAIEDWMSNDRPVPDASGASLSSGHARYTFEYAGLSYVIPSKVLYRTKLDGFDADWSAPTNRRYASYTNLPAGRYTFRVQAANNDGIWNTEGAQLQFDILPPYYRRWWFLLTVGCALLVLGTLLYQRRMRRLHESFESVLAERNRIAREIHDTLAQDLVGVSLQLNLISKLLSTHNVASAAEQLRIARTLVTDSLEQARRSIWNLRRHTSPSTLPSGVTALAEHFAKEGLTIRTNIRGTYRDLPGYIEEEVLKIMREAMVNARNHASAKEVDLDCHYDDETLIVTVRDNGDGFEPFRSEKPGHFGLQGMRERAAAVGGKLSIISSDGTGTLIKLVVPTTGAKRDV